MTRRLAFVAFAVAALAVASPALACNDPRLGSVTGLAPAGGPVSFSAVHLDPGAAYALILDGRTVASGTAGDAAVGGSFTMPDLGRAGTYWLELHVEHEGSTWISSQPIGFVVPEQAPASEPGAATPPPQSKVAAPSIVKPRVAARPAPPPASARAVAAPAVAAAHPAPARPATKTTRSAAQRPISPPVSPRTVPLSAPRALPEPAPLAASLARALPARRHARTVWPLLVAAAALGAAAAGLAGCLRARRARLDAALEAELQQMIAEARAEDAAGLRSR